MGLKVLCYAVLLISVYTQGYGTRDTSEGNIALDLPSEKPTSSVTDMATSNPVSKEGGDILDDIVKEIEEIPNKNDDSTDSWPSAVAVYHPQDCSAPAALDVYCEDVPEEVREYYGGDLSVSGLLGSLFKNYTVEALQSICDPGEWCLPDSFHKDIVEEKTLFYLVSAMCSDAFSTCFQTMLSQRSQCGDEKLNFLAKTIRLLCDMDDVDVLGPECYARTKEALYVTYTDLINAGNLQKSQPQQADCNEFEVHMTKTYLCADDVCNFDHRNLLENFEPWVKIADKASEVVVTCNISHTCQPKTLDSGSNMGASPPSSFSSTKSTDYEYDDDNDFEAEFEKLKNLEAENAEETDGSQINDDGVGKMNANDNTKENSKAMVLGIVAVTAAVLIGLLGLAYIGYRRCGRSSKYKWGYSILTEEDARLLRGDYD